MVMKITSLVALLLVTAHAEPNATVAKVADAPVEPPKMLAEFESLAAEAAPQASGEPSKAKGTDMTSAAMEAAMTDLMLGKTQFGATPMGGSVKTIENLLVKTMMPKIIAAHKSDQTNLNRLAKEIAKCGSTKNSALTKAKPSQGLYARNSKFHQKCRAGEAILLASKKACLQQQRALYNEKVLRCKFFATKSREYGTQKANGAIVKKAGAETTEGYIQRISSTICGNHVHGTKGEKSAKGGWGGGLPNSMLDKYLKAKERCESAKKAHAAKVRECARKSHNYNVKKGKCNQYQGLMDANSCKAAVMVKDACEAYSGCYYAKRAAYRIFERRAIQEETDRKAEWRGLKRMECLIKSFADGKVTGSEVDACKKASHSTKHLKLKYPRIPVLAKCALPALFPATGAYKRKEFSPLPNMAKGVASPVCAGMDAVPTKPYPGSPKTARCERLSLQGAYSAGALVKCTNGFDVYKSQQKNSCPRGTKIWAPATRADWRTFLASAGPLRAPHWIVDITRPSNGCGGCTSNPMNSKNKNQQSWGTVDGAPWWLRSTKYSEPNGDYKANCYMDLWHGKPRTENVVSFNDGSCNYHSKSYYCQPLGLDLKPNKGSPKSCSCSKVDLSGTYTPGVLVKCEQCITVYRSSQKNSCPSGMKIFSPTSRQDWKTFLDSAGPLKAPHWIIDITRPQNGCGGCSRYSMKSTTPQQATWKTSDGSAWWLRSTRYSEPNGDYTGNCFMNMHSNPASADTLKFNDWSCNVRSRSYYCQPKKNDKNYGGFHRRRRAAKVQKQPEKKVARKQPKKKLAKPDLPRGVQLNYDQLGLFKKGWKVWSDENYGHNTNLKSVQPTSGDCIMWGSKRSAGETKLSVAAFGRRNVIKNQKRIQENGVFWYTGGYRGKSGEDGGSVGFSPNNKIRQHSADVENSDAAKRLSWHLHKFKVGGYRSGRTAGLNNDKGWRKVVMYGPCKGMKK